MFILGHSLLEVAVCCAQPRPRTQMSGPFERTCWRSSANCPRRPILSIPQYQNLLRPDRRCQHELLYLCRMVLISQKMLAHLCDFVCSGRCPWMSLGGSTPPSSADAVCHSRRPPPRNELLLRRRGRSPPLSCEAAAAALGWVCFRLTFWPRFYNSSSYARNQHEKKKWGAAKPVFFYRISMRFL